MASNNRPSKAERTSAAREQARQLHEQQAAAAKRKSLLVKIGVVAAVVLVIGLIAMIILQNSRGDVAESGPAPKGGNEYGGITLVSDTEAAPPPASPLTGRRWARLPKASGAEAPRSCRGGEGPAGTGGHLRRRELRPLRRLRIGVRRAAEDWVAAKDITLEYRNVAYLDRNSSTNYSSRGANAMACVADAAPASYLPFAEAMFAHHSQGEMSNKDLAELAKANGADVSSCIEDGTFRPFVKFTDQSSRIDAIPGTPSVWVQGKVWDAAADTDFAPWAQELIDANK